MAVLVSFEVLSACGGGSLPQRAELRDGARVRFVAPGFSRAPRTGLIGRAGDCTAVMVPDVWAAPRRFDVVPIDSLRQLQVSTRYDGRVAGDGTRRIYTAGADTAGETWVDVPVDPVRARYGGCTTGM